MKTHTRLIMAALLVIGTAIAAAPVPDLDSLRVEHQVLPIFPEDLTRIGIREGEVRVALSVDRLGNLEDLLVISHTHPRFAEVTLLALRKWRFAPLRYHGEPVASTTILRVGFETKGAVVTSISAHDQVMLLVMPMIRDSFGYRMRTLQELDQIPTPIAVRAPAYPRELAAKGVRGQVTVGFFIDETGTVRIPSVDSSDDPQLAALAIDALRQWRFEPPRCKGHPVLVRASQVFNFEPSDDGKFAGGTRKS